MNTAGASDMQYVEGLRGPCLPEALKTKAWPTRTRGEMTRLSMIGACKMQHSNDIEPGLGEGG